VLVACDDHGLALAHRQGHGNDLLRKDSARLCSEGALLAAERKRILVGARHFEIRCNVLARLGHRVDAVLILEQRIDEAPADGRVVELLVAPIGRIGLRQNVGRTAHALDASRDD